MQLWPITLGMLNGDYHSTQRICAPHLHKRLSETLNSILLKCCSLAATEQASWYTVLHGSRLPTDKTTDMPDRSQNSRHSRRQWLKVELQARMLTGLSILINNLRSTLAR